MSIDGPKIFILALGFRTSGFAIGGEVDDYFFDLDDTLLDHDSAARVAVTKLFQAFRSHFDGDLKEFLDRWEKVSEKHFRSNELFRKYTFLE